MYACDIQILLLPPHPLQKKKVIKVHTSPTSYKMHAFLFHNFDITLPIIYPIIYTPKYFT